MEEMTSTDKIPPRRVGQKKPRRTDRRNPARNVFMSFEHGPVATGRLQIGRLQSACRSLYRYPKSGDCQSPRRIPSCPTTEAVLSQFGEYVVLKRYTSPGVKGQHESTTRGNHDHPVFSCRLQGTWASYVSGQPRNRAQQNAL